MVTLMRHSTGPDDAAPDNIEIEGQLKTADGAG